MQKKTSPSLKNYFRDYAAYHQTRGNQITHWIGIPSIVISLLGGLSHLGTPSLNAGIVFWIFGVAWYLFLEWKIGLPFALVTLGFYLIGTLLSPLWLSSLFIGGWAIQLLGHSFFEKNRPALLTNLRHLMIGPLWLFSKLIQFSASNDPNPEEQDPDFPKR